jgi:predicted GIY-YIG superfamily endonuclease
LKYVYLLQSLRHPDRRYIGISNDPGRRLAEHNAGKSPHTAKYVSWKTVVVIGFDEDERAFQFERYLKTGSGRAFANKHFL